MYTTRTAQIDYNVIGRLHDLLIFALDFYHQRLLKLSNEMVNKMHDAGYTKEELLEHAIDPTPYFPDVETFIDALANMPRPDA